LVNPAKKQQTAVALRANIGSKSVILLQQERGPVDPTFQVEGVAPHQPEN